MPLFKILDKIVERTKMPLINDFTGELKKIALFRIITGFVLITRYWQIAHTNFIFDGNLSITSFPIVFFMLSLLFILGFLTPLVNLIFLLFVNYADMKMGTSTLGTSILTLLLICFFLINSGQFYSIDRWLIQRNRLLGKAIRSIFNVLSAENVKDIKRAYFLSFFMYGMISCGALLLHIKDPQWTNGLTTKSLLLNSYLCKHYELFRFIDESVPILLSALSILAGLYQSIFQFFMIPLVFFKIGRKFVYLWGMQFYLISLFFINLSYLPHIEVILWLAIFKPVKISTDKIQIFYDDYCNLCKQTMLFFKNINLNNKMEFLAVSLNKEKYEVHNLDEKTVKAYMAGIYRDKLYVGYDLYLIIFRHNPVLIILYPILFMGKIFGIGKRVYDYIAERRYKVFGLCEFSTNDIIAEKEKIYTSTNNVYLFKPVYSFYIFVIACYFFYNFNFFDGINNTKIVDKYYAKHAIRLAGFDLPDVFNKVDLSMGDVWMEIYRIESDSILIPFSGKNGERLNYSNFDYLNFTNHNSDILYFNTTLQFRRRVKGNDYMTYFQPGNYGYYNLKRRLDYDYKFNKFETEKIYFIKVVRNDMNNVQISNEPTEFNEKTVEFTALFKMDNNYSLERIDFFK